ncbi:MAG: hypothetical protein AAF518_02180 [Spirochaetota bacterium]
MKPIHFFAKARTIAVLLLYASVGNGLFADSVFYKTGKKDENVKTRIKIKKVKVKSQDGNTKAVLKNKIKKIKFARTIWKKPVVAQPTLNSIPPPALPSATEQKKAEEKRLEEETQDGNEWVTKPEAEKIDPTTNAALALIPGYSGLFRTENYLGGGLLSFAELAAIGLAADASRAQSTNSEVEGATTNEISVYVPAVAVFGLLSIDSYLSYRSAELWNQGTFVGKKYPVKHTSRWSRFWRSAIAPGWGQHYAGEKGKGAFIMGTALLAVTALGYTDIEIENGNANVNNAEFVRDVLILASASPDAQNSDQFGTFFLLSSLSVDTAESSRSQAQSQFNSILAGYGALYVYNLVDALFFSGTNIGEEPPGKQANSLRFVPDISWRPRKILGRTHLENYYGGRMTWNW